MVKMEEDPQPRKKPALRTAGRATSTQNQLSSDQVDTARSGDGSPPHGSPAAEGDTAGTKPEMRNILRILRYGTTLDYFVMGVGAICSIGSGVTLPLMNLIFGNLVGSFSKYGSTNSPIGPDAFQSIVNRQTLYLVYLFAGKLVLSYIAMLAFRMTGLRISARLRLAYLKALFSQPLTSFDAVPVGTVTSRITTSSNAIQMGVSEKISLLLQFTALLVGAFIVGFLKQWKLALVCCAVFPVILITFAFTIPVHMKLQKKVEDMEERASGFAGEVFGSVRTVIAFGAETALVRRYAGLVAVARDLALKLSPWIGLQYAPIFFVVYSAFAITFWFGFREYRSGDVANVGIIITVLFSVMMGVMSIGNILTPLASLTKAASASTALFATIDQLPQHSAGLKSPIVSAKSDLRFENVFFSYPTRPGVLVLDSLNIRFQANKVTAIVGPSGSGKSTIVGLLEKWYTLEKGAESSSTTPTRAPNTQKPSLNPSPNAEKLCGEVKPSNNRGAVFIGDVNLAAVDQTWWRSQIGLVLQEPFLFNDTVFNNVAYGLIGTPFEHYCADCKRQLIEEACKEAYAHDFIEKMPHGYKTTVGEMGVKLSGGQRQRIAIARSIVKRPDILILDEATSAIDIRSERIVQAALDKASRDRTTIVIAHRLSTIQRANHIVVLSKGKVVEEGTHQSLLLEAGGVYSQLVNAQSLKTGNSTSKDITDEDEDETFPKEVEAVSVPITSKAEQDSIVEAVTESRHSKQRRSHFFSLFQILYEQRGHWILYILLVVAAIGCGAGFPAQSYIFAEVITVFGLPPSEVSTKGNFWSLMFFILAIGIGICYFIMGFSASRIAVEVVADYKSQYFNSIIRKSVPFFDVDSNSSGTLVGRLSTDPTQLQEFLGPSMGMLLIAVVNLTGGSILGFIFGWKLSLVAFLAAMPPVFIATYCRLRFELQFERMNSKVFEESAQLAAEAVGAFRTVSCLTLEGLICNRYDALLRKHVKTAFSKARYATLIFALSESIELCSMALAFWYGSTLLAKGEYGVKQFFIIYSAVVQGGQAAGHFAAFSPNMAQASAAASRIIHSRDESREAENKHAEERNQLLLEDDTPVTIEFKDVAFAYESRPSSVFSRLNLRIEGGQFVALVGPSGCGKTTIISLLEQFYQINAGSIRLNGVGASTVDVKSWRAAFSLVAQQPSLYQGTITENIKLAVQDVSVADGEIERACRDAGIHEFIVSLPDGYNTQVGSRGIALSGGQKQRIAIARALVRNPRVLLLDEATSSLDSESEKLVQVALERAAVGRTMIVVAHRLATVQRADRIYVFNEVGSVVESGTHVELLNKRGAYHSMCEAQALDQ